MKLFGQKKSCQKNRPRVTLLLVILCIFMAPIFARAEEKDYSVPSANFEVEIGNDGKVHVTENWEVSFEEGNFTRFYKDIYTSVPYEELFQLDEDSVRVSIDGQECTLVHDTDQRKDYTFYLEPLYNRYTVHCFLHSREITRNYQISYTINDAVKIVDGEYYLVTFRLIGANFSKEVDNVSARFTAPEGATAQVRNGQYFDTAESEGSTVNVAAKNWKGVLKVKVRIDNARIAGAVEINKSMLSNPDQDRDMTKRKGIYRITYMLKRLVPDIGSFLGILFGGFGVPFMIYIYIEDKVKKASLERNIARDPYYYFDVAGKWKGRLDPCEFAFGSNMHGNENIFYVLFHQLLEKGGLRVVELNRGVYSDVEDSKFAVGNREWLTSEEQAALDFFVERARAEDGELRMECFREYLFNNNKELPDFDKKIRKSYEEQVKAKLSKKEMKKYKKDWKAVYEYMLHFINISDEYNISDIKHVPNWNYMMVFFDWLAYNPLSLYAKSMSSGKDLVLNYIHTSTKGTYNIGHGGSSGGSSGAGSGCSSCSSCSGCGGGGAD